MSTLAVDAPPRTRRLWRVAVSSDVIAIAAVSTAFAVLAVLTWHAWGDLGRDTGYDLVAGARVAHGQLPYVDFVYYYGPLAPMLVGLAALIGGTGLAPAVGLGLAIAYAIVLAVYALARTQAGPLGASLAAAITAGVAFSPTNFSFVLPHTYSATLAVLMTLGFLLALHRAEVTARGRWLVAAGVLAGLSGLTRPEFAAAVLVGGALWVWARRQAGAGGARSAGLLIAPALLVPAVVYGAFLTSISAHRLVFDNLYPVAQLRAAGNAVLRIDAPLTLESFLVLGLRLCLYAAGVALLLLIARAIEAPGTARRVMTPLLVAGAAAAVVLSVLRSETLRYGLEFAYGWIPAGAAFATILLAYRVRRSRSASDSVALACAAVLTVLAAKSYGGFFLHASRAQAAVYAAPFAAVLPRPAPPRRSSAARRRGVLARAGMARVPRRRRRRSRAEGRSRGVGPRLGPRRNDRRDTVGCRRLPGGRVVDHVAHAAGRADPARAPADRALHALGPAGPAHAALGAPRGSAHASGPRQTRSRDSRGAGFASRSSTAEPSRNTARAPSGSRSTARSPPGSIVISRMSRPSGVRVRGRSTVWLARGGPHEPRSESQALQASSVRISATGCLRRASRSSGSTTSRTARSRTSSMRSATRASVSSSSTARIGASCARPSTGATRSSIWLRRRFRATAAH